jgi:3-oxoacyl-[acyl-carrier protein] reductase
MRDRLTQGPELAGRTAVVTGGARNIGLAIGRALCEAGARVILVDRDEEALAKAGRNLGCATLHGDIAADSAESLAGRVLEDHGPVDLIVNNVGIATASRFRDVTEDEFDLVLRTNLRGPWFFTRALVEPMIREHRHGAILFISSLHSSHVRLFPHYSASKAAVAMLVKELAHELGPSGIRVNALSPGWIGPADDALRHRVPLGRSGSPEDVATMALALLDDAVSGYVTGADVPVDGGLALHTWIDEPPGARGQAPRK